MPATLTPNQRAWVEELRSGNRRQVRNSLKSYNSITGEAGFCCLGVAAEMARCREVVAAGEPAFTGAHGDTYVSFPPLEAMVWLGAFENVGVARSTDVYLDAPDEIRTLQQQMREEDQTWALSNEYDRPRIDGLMSAAALNDEGFTFSQIADMVEYFGVKPGVVPAVVV